MWTFDEMWRKLMCCENIIWSSRFQEGMRLFRELKWKSNAVFFNSTNLSILIIFLKILQMNWIDTIWYQIDDDSLWRCGSHNANKGWLNSVVLWQRFHGTVWKYVIFQLFTGNSQNAKERMDMCIADHDSSNVHVCEYPKLMQILCELKHCNGWIVLVMAVRW